MGKMIGSLITKKKRKKISKQMVQESLLQAEIAKENVGLENEAQDIMTTRANFQMVQDRIQGAREALMRRSNLVQSAVNAGAGTSTAAQMGTDSLFTQFTNAIGMQTVFAGYSSALSGINETIGQNNTEIIDSQGRQVQLDAAMAKQQEKAELIGGAIDLGLSVATSFISPAAGFSMLSNAGSNISNSMGFRSRNLASPSTRSMMGSGGGGIWNSSSGNFLTNMFSKTK